VLEVSKFDEATSRVDLSLSFIEQGPRPRFTL
jgi:hypothetical protein